jgi:hypothetical protein
VGIERTPIVPSVEWIWVVAEPVAAAIAPPEAATNAAHNKVFLNITISFFIKFMKFK